MPSPRAVGFVWHDAFLVHDTGPGHPERPERLTAIRGELEGCGLLRHLVAVAPREATLEDLCFVHRPEYVQRVAIACRQGQRYLDSLDTAIGRDSFRVALLAAGAGLAAVDAVMAGSVTAAFCCVRPPGHHAEADRAMGFCLFNNVAVAARHAQSAHGLARVLVCDFDVHHGNGTQHAFYSDPSVFYMSVHQFPFYPGTGAADEEGTGPGRGTTFNAPLPPGSGDSEFVNALEDLERRMESFAPELVLVSAGFDAHHGDPLGNMEVTAEGYRRMTACLRRIAERHAQGRLVALLEGGYHLVHMPRAVRAHLEELART